MRVCFVLLAAAALACGGGGGNGYPTSTGNNTGTTGGTGNTGGGSGNATGSASVTMKQGDDGYGYAVFSFAPANVTITKGGTVTWTNEAGTTAHNVTFSSTGSPSNVANFTTGSVTRTFNQAGTFSYECTNHSGMTGTVTVQ